MCNEGIQLYIDDDGKANLYDDTYDIIIHCETEEERDKVMQMLKRAKETHWIPCSERLPDDNDYRECMECLDGAVWYFTKNGAMGLGYYYKSTKEWATTDDLKTDGKVVAWMPLPSPYQPEEESE